MAPYIMAHTPIWRMRHMAHTPYGVCAIYFPLSNRARRATQLSPVREKYNCSKSEGKKFALWEKMGQCYRPRCIQVCPEVIYMFFWLQLLFMCNWLMSWLKFDCNLIPGTQLLFYSWKRPTSFSNSQT